MNVMIYKTPSSRFHTFIDCDGMVCMKVRGWGQNGIGFKFYCELYE